MREMKGVDGSLGNHAALPSIEHLKEFFRGSELLRYLEAHPITLLPTTQQVPLTQIESLARSPDQRIFVCDFPIAGFEKSATLRPYGYVSGRVTNFDHHFDIPEMRRYISTGNLVLLYLKENAAVVGSELVVIHHKDCDSLLSSLMLRGALPADERFGKAVIDADHRGVENPISDLLQGLQLWGKELPAWERMAFSVRNLELLLDGKDLHPEAERALSSRRSQRAEAEKMAKGGSFTREGALAYAIADSKIDPELFLPHLPDARHAR